MCFDFAIVGAQKASSSDLHYHICEHSEIGCEFDEKVFFEAPFYSIKRVDDEIDRLRSLCGIRKFYGFKRPNLLTDSEAPSRLAQHNPHAKIIVVLREPGDRALSAYAHFLRTGMVPWPSDIEARLRQIFSGDCSDLTWLELQIAKKGLYARGLRGWSKFYPEEQIWVGTRQDFIGEDGAPYGSIEHFLNVKTMDGAPANWQQAKHGCYNSMRIRFYRLFRKFCVRRIEDSEFYNFRRPQLLTCSAMRAVALVDRYLLRRLFKKNDFILSESTKSLIAEYYADDLKELQKSYGVELKAWKYGS
jgi:hypothetical protein